MMCVELLLCVCWLVSVVCLWFVVRCRSPCVGCLLVFVVGCWLLFVCWCSLSSLVCVSLLCIVCWLWRFVCRSVFYRCCCILLLFVYVVWCLLFDCLFVYVCVRCAVCVVSCVLCLACYCSFVVVVVCRWLLVVGRLVVVACCVLVV